MKHKKFEKKFSLKELIWLGFNLTCSVAFTAVFADMMLNEDGTTGYSLGFNLLWILALDGIMALICAWAFTRMSQSHKETNGGAFVYTRTNFGTFAGWMVSFMQFTTMPLIIMAQLVPMVRLNFVSNGSDPSSKTFLDTTAFLGNWANLTWDSFGILIYIAVASTLFFGMKFLKKWLNLSSYIKWGSSLLLIGSSVALFALSGSDNLVANYQNTSLSIDHFTGAFTSCFFFFLGFETLATMGKNVENPRKNMGKAMFSFMLISILFYVSVAFIFLGAIGGHYTSNPNLQVFKNLGESKKVLNWIYYAGVIVMLICTISLKMNASTQLTIYASACLEPYAKEGLMPEKFAVMNKDNLPIKGVIFNMILTVLMLVTWLIIPDLIQALNNQSESVFEYSALTGEVSLLFIIVYLAVIFTCLKCAYKKEIKANLFEISIWTVGFLFLIFQLEEFFRTTITSFANAVKTKDLAAGISSGMQLFLVFVLNIFSSLWYKFYYMKKRSKREKNNPSLQRELDSEYVLMTQWSLQPANTFNLINGNNKRKLSSKSFRHSMRNTTRVLAKKKHLQVNVKHHHIVNAKSNAKVKSKAK